MPLCGATGDESVVIECEARGGRASVLRIPAEVFSRQMIGGDGSGPDPERRRLQDAHERSVPWHRWGPYLTERQWGTVREDYSATGDAWDSFPYDMALYRAYRWGEDGLLGICDRE